MQIHYLQHVPFEGLGCIHEWGRNNGHAFSTSALFAGDALPDPAGVAFLIVMGGPMGVYDTVQYPWISSETQFIADCIRQEKKILGIGLGAQMIAKALGASVYPNPTKEIGWYPVTAIPAAEASGLASFFPQTFNAFHWHSDTFDLPDGAVHLAQSRTCRHQAFLYPPMILGLQFHLESTHESIRALIHNCGDELVSAPDIQTKDQILDRSDLVRPSDDLMGRILDIMTQAL